MNRRIQLLLAGLHGGAEGHDITGGLEGESFPDVQAIRRRGLKDDALWRRGGVNLVGNGIPVHRDAINRLVDARARRRIVHGEDERRDRLSPMPGGRFPRRARDRAARRRRCGTPSGSSARASRRGSKKRLYLGCFDNDLTGCDISNGHRLVPTACHCLRGHCGARGALGACTATLCTLCTLRTCALACAPAVAFGATRAVGGGGMTKR